jgi:hypothetical protein
MKAITTAGAVVLSAFLVSACDDRRERIEETAAPGMEQDAAAPGSGPVDLDDRMPPADTTPGDTLVDQTLPPITPEGQAPPNP